MTLCTYFMVDFRKSWEAAHVSVSMVLNQMRRTRASWDCADFEVWGQREVLERRRPVRRSSCDEIADKLQRQWSGESRVTGKRKKESRVDVIGVGTR